MQSLRVNRWVAGAGFLSLCLFVSGVSLSRAADGGAQPQGVPLRVALLPFAIQGAPPQAWGLVRAALEAHLPSGTLTILDHSEVASRLRARRLRDMSLLTRPEMALLAADLGADRLLLGSLYRFDEGPVPVLCLSGRLIDPSKLGIEGMAFTVLEGTSLLGPLGSGGPVTPERALGEGIEHFITSLLASRRGLLSREDERMLDTSVLAPPPVVYVSPRIGEKHIQKVVVLPFRNHTRRVGAGLAAADLVTWCLLAASDLSLVYSGDATRRLLERGWRTGMAVGRDDIVSLGVDLHVDAVLMGSVSRWQEGRSTGVHPPEVSVSFRLLDAVTGEILWAAEHERIGDQTRTFYEAGNIRLAEALMARASLEALQPLLRALNKSKHSETGGPQK